MMYMPDAVKALIDLSQADKSDLRYPTSYNVSSLSFFAERLTREIKKHIPGFKAVYDPDSRQEIVDSWPEDLDDSAARSDWGWSPDYGLQEMTEDMIENLRGKLNERGKKS